MSEYFINDEYNVSLKAEKSYGSIKDFISDMNISKRLFTRAYLNKDIFVNGSFRRKDLPIIKGEIFTLHMPEEDTVYDDFSCEMDVVYEDVDVMIVNKAPFILVHETKNNMGNTLFNAIRNRWYKEGLKRRVRLVNRLDMNTSGLMTVAKNPYAHMALSKQMEDNTMKKKYILLCEGNFEKESIAVESYIGEDENDDIKKTISSPDKGFYAKTVFNLKKNLKGMALVEAELFTGRTHQIRLHLKECNHPLIGDNLYNDSSILSAKRQMLHSYFLQYEDVRNKKIKTFKIPAHKDFKDFLIKLDIDIEIDKYL